MPLQPHFVGLSRYLYIAGVRPSVLMPCPCDNLGATSCPEGQRSADTCLA